VAGSAWKHLYTCFVHFALSTRTCCCATMLPLCCSCVVLRTLSMCCYL